MNTFNVTGGVDSQASAALSWPVVAPPAGPPAAGFVASPISSRDSQLAGLSDISSSVNSLQQAASLQLATSQQTAGDSAEPLLDLPALAPMPAPKAAPAVPVDDHGQSNIVFSDTDYEGSLIH